jgi:2-C-methyl-D-erythritol 4-phosphate cytidylyltransferase
MRKFAVIVAGGSGSRMGAGIPKQFLELCGKPVLVHTIRAFLRAYEDMSIVVVLPAAHLEKGKEILEAEFAMHSLMVTEGGLSRFESVRNGLSHVDRDSIVFVHDAVRCLVSPLLIRNCYEKALHEGSAIPVVPLKDSIRRLVPGGSEVVNREELRAVQTPQTFVASILLDAFRLEYNESFTDEATVVEFAGGKVNLIEGEESNIKITYPSDLRLAEQLLSEAGV